MSVVDPFINEAALGSRCQIAPIVKVDGSAQSPALVANGLGAWLNVDGIGGHIVLKVTNVGAGTCTFALNGAVAPASTADSPGTPPVIPVRIAKLGSAGPLIAIISDAVAANSNQFYEVLDRFPSLQALISAAAGAISVTTTYYLVPNA